MHCMKIKNTSGLTNGFAYLLGVSNISIIRATCTVSLRLIIDDPSIIVFIHQ